MVHCKVTITMPDGSKGDHEGKYADTVDATVRALELFPEARKIDVVAEGSSVVPMWPSWIKPTLVVVAT